jgi:predicted dehydrogenase/threonine dehydrogenase-like Zn-dependent dehydrogenase
MKQVFLNPGNGEITVREVPIPALKAGGVLVKTAYSVISTGTERLLLQFSKEGILGKAKSRPDLVKQVIEKFKREGFISTLKASLNRLSIPLSPGYSSSGVVIAVGEKAMKEFKIGDRVACGGGGYASHAEIVYVPINLCCKVPDGVDLLEASFTTIGSIAIEGIRLAEVSIGENIGVIGLGLIGLLTIQILKAAGCRVMGIDINPKNVELAKNLGIDEACLLEEHPVEEIAMEFTKGYGLDKVIITASTRSNEPMVLAGKIARDRGIIVVVGAVRMDIPRDIYYNKALEVRVSRSYGPGRYDPDYEEKGIDYPYGYVRWTEKRNMESFLTLLEQGKVNVKALITHRFPIEEAPKAYEVVEGKTTDKPIAILLTYPATSELSERKIFVKPKETAKLVPEDRIGIGVIGAGNFARLTLLPILRKIPKVELLGIATTSGLSSRDAADKFGFNYCTTDYYQLLEDPQINLVIVLVRHNLHAKIVIEALEAGKNVFVEKPLALNDEELERVIEAEKKSGKIVMVGFNRRFSPFVQRLKSFFSGGPLIMHYRVNAGKVPIKEWVQGDEGGGRVIGEVCHFVDTLQYIAGAFPIRVYADAIESTQSDSNDNLIITLHFCDGSVGSILYTAEGDKSFPKERIEVFGKGGVGVLEDFRSLILMRGGKRKKFKILLQDKGHKAELEALVEMLLSGNKPPFQEYVLATRTTFRIKDSLCCGMPIEIYSGKL